MADSVAPDEETHVWLSDVQHCLQRADAYLGDIDPAPTPYLHLVKLPEDAGGGFAVEQRTAVVSVAMTQLFLEILTNANDHFERPDTHVKNIWVTMDRGLGRVTVKNDGASIPVRKHSQFTDDYLTTVIFSKFHTSSNYNDDEARTGAGRFGVGAKGTNAWSTKFTVDHHDGEYQFEQTFRDNLSVVEEARVRKNKRKGTYTSISFVLDWERLKIPDVGEAIDYLRSYVWMLGCASDPKLAVHLDGERLPVRNIKEYAKALCGGQGDLVVHDAGHRFEVAIIPQVHPDGTELPKVLGFVNAVPCHAGTHVNYAMKRVCDALGCSPTTAANHLTLLVNCKVVNPRFESLCKDKLTLPISKAGGAKWEMTKAFELKLKKSAVAKTIQAEQNLRDEHRAKVATAGGSSVGGNMRAPNIENYETAHLAGKKNPNWKEDPVTLILTEGISAKQFAVAGLSVVGRAKYGVFPLKGKPINVLAFPIKKVLENAEMINLLRILGVNLVSGKPTSPEQLRYQRIVLMADQDDDGTHIVGLMANALHFFMPEVMRACPDFLQRFSTPLVRATPKSATAATQAREFASETAFEAWWETVTPSQRAKYAVKYFKGLGTSTPKEAKECFAHWSNSTTSLNFTDQKDRDLLLDYFAKDKGKERTYVDRRREILCDIQPLVNYDEGSVLGGDFLRGDLAQFSRADNARSIPDAVDGLKPAQRKVLWAMLTKHLNTTTTSLKVAQLAGFVAEHTGYHHGEASLCGCIVNMARDHPPLPKHSNNINLLTPGGMFGDRHMGEAASPRYIFTCLEPIARRLFPPEDLAVLESNVTESMTVESKRLVPVIPFALVNGQSGTGTGWSSKIPPHDPGQLIAWCRAHNALLQHGGSAAALPPITPFLEGYAGPSKQTGNSWTWEPVIDQIGNREVRVRELPTLTCKFPPSGFKQAHWIQANNTDVTVDLLMHFEEDVTPELLDELRSKASESVSMTNMHLWGDDPVRPRLFATAEEVAKYHTAIRLDVYRRRRVHELAGLKADLLKVSERWRFVSAIVSNELVVVKVPRVEVEAWLDSHGFTRIDDKYEHLMSMPIHSLTSEMLDKLDKEHHKIKEERDLLEKMNEHDLWNRDLDLLDEAYTAFLNTRRERRRNPESVESAVISLASGASAAKGKGRKRKAKNAPAPETLKKGK